MSRHRKTKLTEARLQLYGGYVPKKAQILRHLRHQLKLHLRRNGLEKNSGHQEEGNETRELTRGNHSTAELGNG